MAVKILKNSSDLHSALPPDCMRFVLSELGRSGVSFSESVVSQLTPPSGKKPTWTQSMTIVGLSPKNKHPFARCEVLAIEDGFSPVIEKEVAIRWEPGAFGEDATEIDILGLLIPVRCLVDGWERSAVLAVAAWWDMIPYFGPGRDPGHHKPRPGARILACAALAVAPDQLAAARQAVKPVAKSEARLEALFLRADRLWNINDLLAHDRVARMIDQAALPGLKSAAKGPRL